MAKYKYLIIWGAALVAVAATIVVVAIAENSKTAGNKGLKGLLKSKKLRKDANILFVGDSITEEFYQGAPTYTYAYLIKHKYLSDKSIDILAVGSMQTSWMLQNLPAQLAKKKYDRVYIWGGINDIFSNVTAVKATANIQAMVDMVNAQYGEAYVILGYDTKKFTPDSKLKTTDYVTTIAGMAALRDKYIVYQEYLKNNINSAVVVPEFELDSTMNYDGIHPTMAAHEIIAHTLLKGIIYKD